MNRFSTVLLSAFVLGLTSISCLDSNISEVNNRETELLNLKSYISNLIAKGNDVDTTDLGVYYIITEQGEGNFPKNGDTLTVTYAAYYIDGYLFDSSLWRNPTDSTYTFVLGNPPNIAGWDDGMKVLNKNAKAQLMVSSDLAFGDKGNGIIPPFQTLVFVVKMKNIKPI